MGPFSGLVGRLPAGSVARGAARPERPVREHMGTMPEAQGTEGEPDSLGIPLNIVGAARLIGCSPWTVRQRLIPLGLPYFRSAASGKLIFYSRQLTAWILKQQGGNLP